MSDKIQKFERGGGWQKTVYGHMPTVNVGVNIPLTKKRKPSLNFNIGDYININKLEKESPYSPINVNEFLNLNTTLGGMYDFDSGQFGLSAGISGYSPKGKLLAGLNGQYMNNPYLTKPVELIKPEPLNKGRLRMLNRFLILKGRDPNKLSQTDMYILEKMFRDFSGDEVLSKYDQLSINK